MPKPGAIREVESERTRRDTRSRDHDLLREEMFVVDEVGVIPKNHVPSQGPHIASPDAA